MTLLLPFWVALCGALGVKALDRRGLVGWPLAAVLGPAAGFGGLSLLYFFCRLAGMTGGQFRVLGWLLLVLVTAAALRRCLALCPSRPVARSRFSAGEWFALGLLLLGLVLAVVALVLYARQRPHGTFDAWAIWTSRARLLFRGTDLPAIFSVLRKAHPDYPLLIPGSLAAQFTLAASESARLPQVTGGLFTLATVGGVGLGVYRLSGHRTWAALAAALLSVTPMFLFWGGSQCADLPLACILLLTCVALAALLDRERAPWIPAGAAGFLLGLLGWTKNEGMPLTLILLALFAAGAWWTGRRALLVPVVAGALPAWLAALLFRWLWAPRTDLGHFAGDLFERLAEPTRWRIVGEAFALRLDPVRGFDSWGVVWLAAGLALLAGAWLHRGADPALRFSRWVLLAVWLAWFGVFVGTPVDLAWHLETALDRLLLQLLPLTLTVAAAGLALASSRRPRGSRASTILLMASLLGLAGCRSAPEGFSRERWIATAPQERLEVDRLLRDETISEWPFAATLETPADRAAWRVGPGTSATSRGGLLLTPGDKGRASLQRNVEIDSAVVDALRLELAGASGGTLALMWADAGEPFGVARRLELDLGELRGAVDATATFEVRGHAEWSGRVERLRLDYTHHRGRQALEVRTLRAARRVHDDGALAASAGHPWRVEVDHERRDAFVAAPKHPLVWKLPAPAAGELRFGFACAGAAVGTTTFRVFRDRAATPLFEARVGEGHRAAERWFDVVLAEDTVRGATQLRFEVDYPLGERRGLAFWSAPELVRGTAPEARPDILLVSIDTLRPDRLSLYGAERQTSPQLDAWATSAVVFDKVVTSSPWTLPAHISLFSGRDALAHGVNHRTQVPTDLPLLTEALRAAGYSTWAITGGGYLDPDYGLDRGFDRYRYWPEHTGEEELETHLETAFEWLDSAAPQPLFLFFHTYEVHHPYRPRQPYFERFTGGREAPAAGALGYVNLPQTEAGGFELTKQWRRQGDAGERLPLDADAKSLLVDLYDSGVAYADAQLARLLKRWAVRDDGQGTVAITSDHGEALGEKGLAGHAYVEDFNALVPLILRLPGGQDGARIRTQVRLLDLAPTLADLAGLEPLSPSDGLSLLPLVAGGGGEHRPAWLYAGFSNRGLALRLSDRWKYVYNDTAWPALHGLEALFDLRRDPLEEVDLSTEDVDRTASLRELARDQIAGVASAIRISLANHGPNPVGGRLVGTVLQPSRLKSPQLPRGAVGRIPGGASIHAGPGETVVLLLASPGAGAVAVSLEPDFKESVELATLDHPWRVGLGDDGWRLLPAHDAGEDAAPAAVLSIEWAADRKSLTADPATENAELRRQLEALGYIE